MSLFSPPSDSHRPEVLMATAMDAEPGDEVIFVDDAGKHEAVHVEYAVTDASRPTVTLVPAGDAEREVARDRPVLLIRGAGTLLTMIAADSRDG